MDHVTRFAVTGLSCGGCVSSLIESVGSPEGVTRVEVELHPGALSMLTLVHERELDDEAIRAAITRAGFSVEHVGVVAERTPGL